MTRVRVALGVATALAAFAGNSLLCRAALGAGHADPATFTLVRVACGAATVAALARARGLPLARGREGLAGRATALAAYAILFSVAYVRVPAGVGALVLFACVQTTMLVAAVRAGDGPRRAQGVGIALALAGLAALTLPGASAPDPIGVAWMAASGIAWGAYTLRGRRSADPIATTATSFLGATPFAAAFAVVALATGSAHADGPGLALAAASGALASGIGYAIWYAVLPALDRTRAALVQLAVPVLAAFGGTVLLGETPTLRLVLASASILGGIAIGIARPSCNERGAGRG